MGGGGFLDVPITNYTHELNYETGKQEKELVPAIQVPGDPQGQPVSFRIILKPRFNTTIEDKVGRIWIFTMKFCAADGQSVTSEPMAVIMSRF